MAQQASRSSVEVYTNLYFKNKTLTEPGYVIRLLKNGFLVLIPKFGVESVVYTLDSMSLDNGALVSADGSVKVKLFDQVTVSLSIETSGPSARSKLSLKLISPTVPGLAEAEAERTAAAAFPSVKRQKKT